VPRRIRLPGVLGSRGRDRSAGFDPDTEHSESYAARLGRILDPDGTRAPATEPTESSDADSSKRDKREDP
jgi:hypothetical protein